jgi:hypothetical protein
LQCEVLTISLDEVTALNHEVLDDSVKLAALVALRQPAFPASAEAAAAAAAEEKQPD